MDARFEARRMDASDGLFHVRKAVGKEVGVDAVVPERVPPAVQVDVREPASARDVNPVVHGSQREIGEEVGAAVRLGAKCPCAAELRDWHPCLHRHGAKHRGHFRFGTRGQPSPPSGEAALRHGPDSQSGEIAVQCHLDGKVVTPQADGICVIRKHIDHVAAILCRRDPQVEKGQRGNIGHGHGLNREGKEVLALIHGQNCHTTPR